MFIVYCSGPGCSNGGKRYPPNKSLSTAGVDSVVCFVKIYLLDSDLSGRLDCKQSLSFPSVFLVFLRAIAYERRRISGCHWFGRDNRQPEMHLHSQAIRANMSYLLSSEPRDAHGHPRFFP